jgi:hypothetical protein
MHNFPLVVRSPWTPTPKTYCPQTPALKMRHASTRRPVVRRLFNNQVQGETAAVIGDDSDTSKLGSTTIAAQFVDAGFKLFYQQNPMPGPPSPVTDVTPYVQALMTGSGGHPPDVIFTTTGR